MKLDDSAIRKQSESAYNQWCVQWRKQAKIHGQMPQKSWADFEHIGVGKPVVCVANGWSLELEMETLKKHKDNVDILCCDKSLGHLIQNGIKPTYVMVCDANVNYEKYLKPYEKELDQTILFSNVCGNPQWTHNGNWKDIYFFVNMDILGSEKEFCELSGCPNVMPAATNVSNAMVVLLTQCDNKVGRRNFFGYDKILLIGYDYCWNPKGSYYAYNKDGDGKANYMRHVYARNIKGDPVFTSNNLGFSAMWLDKYVGTFKLPVVQCTRESVFLTRYLGSLDDQMQYSFRREDSVTVRAATKRLREIQGEKVKLQEVLHKIALAHSEALAQSF